VEDVKTAYLRNRQLPDSGHGRVGGVQVHRRGDAALPCQQPELPLDQATGRPVKGLPAPSSTILSSCLVSPSSRETDSGTSCTAATVAGRIGVGVSVTAGGRGVAVGGAT